MAATVQAQFANGATPTLANAETGVKYNRDDSQTQTSATIPIPTAAGTNFSSLKYLCLVVTAASTTSISNRRIAWASSPATGLVGWFFNQPTYTQNTLTNPATPAAGTYPANDTTTNGANPGVTPTATMNGAQSSGTVVTVNSGGTSFTSGMVIVIGLGTANYEVRTVTGSSTATTINITSAMAKAHSNADIVAQAYTQITTSNQVWDNSSATTNITPPLRNGNYVQTVLGVDNTYVGGAGSNVALPTLNLVYDEA